MSASGLLNAVKCAEAMVRPGISLIFQAIRLSTRGTAIAGAVFIAICSLFLGGCTTVQGVMQDVKTAATEMTTSAPEIGPYDAPAPVYPTPTVNPQTQKPLAMTAASQPAPPSITPSPAWPAPAAPSQSTHLSESKPLAASATIAATTPPPAPVGKGAAQLMIPNDPPMRVNARALIAETDKKPATLAAADPGPTLIFKGPPHEERSSGSGSATKWVIIFVLLFAGACVAGVALFKMRRKVVIAAAIPHKDKPPAGWEMKEPAGHAPDTVLEG